MPVAVHGICCSCPVVTPEYFFCPLASNTAGPLIVIVYGTPLTYWPAPFLISGLMVPLRFAFVYW